jgi:hypothetical protein
MEKSQTALQGNLANAVAIPFLVTEDDCPCVALVKTTECYTKETTGIKGEWHCLSRFVSSIPQCAKKISLRAEQKRNSRFYFCSLQCQLLCQMLSLFTFHF